MDYKILSTQPIEEKDEEKEKAESKDTSISNGKKSDDKVNPGDVIDFDLDSNQPGLFDD